ncbi:MAG: hypothetical protein P8H13_10490 [Polaribacter sp.]|nr:hypothetical protein [Polaribacter sp.]MDG1812350.1 hypothetical protein [Polaribacter sp.]
MKKTLFILVLFCTTIAFSQKKGFDAEVKKISNKIELITKTEKAALKEKVEKINVRLEKKEITSEDAQRLKKEAADFHAKVISEKVAVEEKKLQQLVQDKANGKIENVIDETDFDDKENSFTIGSKTFNLRVKNNVENTTRRDERWDNRRSKWERKGKRNRSTTSQFVFALGVNNVLVNDDLASLETSNYQFWQSHFYEVGFSWKTRMDREASKLYLKYGLSFLWNNLRPEDNKYHVKNGKQTDLAVYPEDVSENRLRHVQMNFPVHFEWDFSRNGEYADGYKRDRTNQSLRIGVGAFAGFKLGTRQYIEYKDNAGVDIEELQKDNFNMHIFNYGISGYLAYRSTGFYVKYDLNPLFKDTNIRNFSMGVRFDFD